VAAQIIRLLREGLNVRQPGANRLAEPPPRIREGFEVKGASGWCSRPRPCG
jgi:hypothetical protein